jgi:hypothetical protein
MEGSTNELTAAFRGCRSEAGGIARRFVCSGSPAGSDGTDLYAEMEVRACLEALRGSGQLEVVRGGEVVGAASRLPAWRLEPSRLRAACARRSASGRGAPNRGRRVAAPRGVAAVDAIEELLRAAKRMEGDSRLP